MQSAVRWARSGSILPAFCAIEFVAPMPEQEQANRNRIKQTALRYEHRQWNAFPSDCFIALIIEESKKRRGAEYLEAGDAAVKEKTGHRKGTAPAIKSIKRRKRSQQPGPDQASC